MASVLDYPFYKYYYEDKSHYPHAKDMGYNDPTDSFLIGESGGFLLNINPDIEKLLLLMKKKRNIPLLQKVVCLMNNFVSKKLFVEWLDLKLLVE